MQVSLSKHFAQPEMHFILQYSPDQPSKHSQIPWLHFPRIEQNLKQGTSLHKILEFGHVMDPENPGT
jgi:hypothetical protein